MAANLYPFLLVSHYLPQNGFFRNFSFVILDYG